VKGRYGTEVKVGNDIDRPGAVEPDEVTLTVNGEVILLNSEQARKVAKKLKKHASKVDLSNTFRNARRKGTREGTRAEVERAQRGYL
jgi:hypothetical protein